MPWRAARAAAALRGLRAGQAGAAIGGFLLVIAAFVIGVPVGIALYLLSQRLDTDEEQRGSTATGTEASG
jgi:hypothetical protein